MNTVWREESSRCGVVARRVVKVPLYCLDVTTRFSKRLSKDMYDGPWEEMMFYFLANVSGRQRSDWCRYCSVHAFQQDMFQVGLNNFTDYTEKYFSSVFVPTWMIQYSVIDQNTLMYTVKLKDLSVAVWFFNVSIAGIFILFRSEPKKYKKIHTIKWNYYFPFHIWEIWHSFLYDCYLATSPSSFSPHNLLFFAPVLRWIF